MNKNNVNSKNRAAANMVDKAIRKIMSDFQVCGLLECGRGVRATRNWTEISFLFI